MTKPLIRPAHRGALGEELTCGLLELRARSILCRAAPHFTIAIERHPIVDCHDPDITVSTVGIPSHNLFTFHGPRSTHVRHSTHPYTLSNFNFTLLGGDPPTGGGLVLQDDEHREHARHDSTERWCHGPSTDAEQSTTTTAAIAAATAATGHTARSRSNYSAVPSTTWVEVDLASFSSYSYYNSVVSRPSPTQLRTHDRL